MKDEYEIKLDKKIVELKECQKSCNFDSCIPCDKFFSCELRREYVSCVYNSMSKNSRNGGFNF